MDAAFDLSRRLIRVWIQVLALYLIDGAKTGDLMASVPRLPNMSRQPEVSRSGFGAPAVLPA